LSATQKASSLSPAPKIVLTLGETEYTYDTTRILSIKHPEQPYSQTAEVVLHNRDGTLTDIDLKSYKAVISDGLVTSEGNEYSPTAPLWVIGQQFDSSPGELVCRL